MLATVLILASCAIQRGHLPSAGSASDERGSIERLLPNAANDRAGWALDMYGGFAALAIPSTRENICAVISVIEQESDFRVDPVVPGLAAIAWREIDTRAEHTGLPPLAIHTVLRLTSRDGRSYSDRINSATTEKDLSDIYEDFIAAVPLGRSVFAGWNPIRTRGPMQVNVAFAEQYAAAKPYPYPVTVSIADEVFTRRGSLYFGIAHLLAYPESYDRYLFRFADYNAGQYASRNAAFQAALNAASGIPVTPDGALLAHDGNAQGVGSTRFAARALGKQLDISDSSIDDALQLEKAEAFERTPLYRRVFALAEKIQGRPPARALLPRIELHGPKLRRRLTTQWYAHRVDDRFLRCVKS